jgi:hypothetical protein
LFRLALALGMTVAEMLERMDAAELAEWAVYYAIEPWGEAPAHWRNGLLCSMVANAMRGKDQRPFEVADFIPEF